MSFRDIVRNLQDSMLDSIANGHVPRQPLDFLRNIVHKSVLDAYFCKEDGADFNIIDHCWSPIQSAIELGDVAIFKRLIDKSEVRH